MVREVRLTVGDYASPGHGDAPNPCVVGCAHLFLGSLFVMGEGRGGTEGGRVESRLAVSAVLANFRTSTLPEPRPRLVEALQHAGEVLFSRSRSASAFSGSFAACAAVLIRRGRLYAARVGDVRLVVIRDRQAIPIFDRPQTDVAIGSVADLQPDVLSEEFSLRGGDRFVLGNGAMFSVLPATEMIRLATTLVPGVAARRMVELSERSGDPRAVSVQVVQVGDPAVGFEVPSADAADSDGGATPFAPVPILQTPTANALPSHAVLRPRQAGMELGAPKRKRTLPLTVAVAVALALGLVLWRRYHSDSDAPQEPPTAAQPEAASAPPVEPVPEAGFWDKVQSRFDAGGAPGVAELRAWAGDSKDASRRIREAEAVLLALRPPAQPLVDEPSPPPDAEEPEPEASAPAGPDAGAVQPAPRPSPQPMTWEPSKLPTGLRTVDGIFARANTTEAAKRLRVFIHARHTQVERILKLLDGYLAMAPRQRSLTVLEALAVTKPAPGPRTLDWARQAIAKLKAAMEAEQ